MYVSQLRMRGTDERVRNWLTPERIVFYCLGMLLLFIVMMAVWAWSSHAFTERGAAGPGTDFSIFWSASYGLWHGSAAQVYDHVWFDGLQRRLFDDLHRSNLMPWLYPPTFLVFVSPLALLPPLVMYFVFVGGGLALCSAGTLRVSGLTGSLRGSRFAWLIVAASPCVLVPAIFGQNSLLTAALAVFALHWLRRAPLRAGLCIGLLAIKPQMALLFPLVLIAARAWRTLAAATLSAVLFSAFSVLVCGVQTAQQFLVNTGLARTTLLEQSRSYWLASPTAFAALRDSGVPVAAAYAGQASVALIAAASAWYVWRGTRDTRLRVAGLMVATLLANPYVWHYELAWLGIALACLIARGLDTGWLRGEQSVIALAWLLPVYEFFNRVTELPQIGPVVLLLTLLIVVRRVRLGADARAGRAALVYSHAL
ncbi:glycosyltransferase family 87 protein [Burkholderia sp. SRS-W-2-2016]|uniref:glycosyltransferase family 87 protein n=1 Tax=Burkholderia sp. SRS-W-2-2016 TaxID=1926878 RepID=UPI000AF975E7|nr:glycosyltransferase family 87 protein [Burkholderia sp. SRS-W-2-2016]